MTPAPNPTLLERSSERSELEAVVVDAPEGRGGTAVIAGPAGIGKTALLDDARSTASDRGLVVLSARGGELERDFGFGVVRQLLEPVVAEMNAEQRRGLMAGAAALAERVFSPRVARAGSDAPDAAIHGLYWLVVNLAKQGPLLVTVDDAHWADQPSLRFLIYLARRIEGTPAALLLAVRSGERDAERRLLRLLEAEVQPTIVRPKPLSEAAATLLVESQLGVTDPGVARACHQVTRGNPFMLTALLEELSRQGRTPEEVDPARIGQFVSERITAAMLLRIGRLGSSAMRLVEAVTVLGEHASLTNAAALAELAPDQARAAADALAEAGVLDRGRPLRLAHPIVRAAIYDDIAEGARSAMHARAAAVLAEAGEPPEVVAPNLLAVEHAGDASVVERLREAATAAHSRGAAETASLYLRRAMSEPPPETQRSGVALEAGDAAWRTGEPDFLDLMREGFEAASDPPGRARAAVSLAPALMFVGRVDEAVDVLEAALAGLGDDALASGLELMLLAAGITGLSAHRRVLPRLREARSRVESDPTGANPAILSLLTTEVALAGAPAAEVAEIAERALADGSLLSGPMVETPFPYPGGFWLALTDRPRGAIAAMDTALSEARARGSLSGTAFPLAYRALALHRLGALTEAEAEARAAIDAGGGGIPYANAVAIAIAVLLERGEVKRARELLNESDTGIPSPEMLPLLLLREARARLASAEGDHAAGLAELLACQAWEDEGPLVVPVAWRSQAAFAHAALGEAPEARRLAGEEVEIARRFGAPRPLGVALRAAGLVEGGDRGLELLDEAAEALGRSEDRLERGRALVDLGAALRRAGRRKQARGRLASGMDLAHRCGATALVDRAREELRVAGARPRRLASTGRESLTASELRVAGLAAEGMTNPEIAQALFVTLRTVEMHLSNAYRKLEIESRKQLPDALAEPARD